MTDQVIRAASESPSHVITKQGEHYGKLVSNYRSLGIVPPISRKPAAQ